MPSGAALINTPSAVERCCGPKRSEIIDIDAGGPPDSPAPTATRAANRCAKLFAKPQIPVMTLQNDRHTARMRLRLQRSARCPSGTRTIPYTSPKANPESRLSYVSVSARAALSGSGTTQKIARSRLLRMKMTGNRASR